VAQPLSRPVASKYYTHSSSNDVNVNMTLSLYMTCAELPGTCTLLRFTMTATKPRQHTFRQTSAHPLLVLIECALALYTPRHAAASHK
jgi:hypothetical protein